MNHIKATIDNTPAPALRPVPTLNRMSVHEHFKRSDIAQRIHVQTHTIGKRPKAVEKKVACFIKL